MNTRLGIVLIAVLFGWPLMGGCPVTVDADVDIDAAADVAPAADVDANAGLDDGSSNDPGSDANDGAADDDSSDDGDSSPDDGQDQDPGDSADDAGDGADDAGDGADDSGDDDDGGNEEPVFAGTYDGNPACVDTFWTSLTGTEVNNETRPISITFDENGLPTSLVVLGYSPSGLVPAYELVAEVRQVGDAVTLNHSANGYDATVTVTVVLSTYESTSARIVLALVHEGQDDNRNDVGTGIQVIEYSLSNGNLTYSSLTEYEVAWEFPNITVDTTQELDCQGTLAPE